MIYRHQGRQGERSFAIDNDGGFTLIELLIVSVILPMVIGAISVALIAVFSLQSGVSSRLSDSADAQVVSASFVKDVHSALNLTTSTAGGATQCGSGAPLLGLEWSLDQKTQVYQSVVSYYKVQSGSTYSLLRVYCAGGASSIPTTTSTLSYDVGASSSQVTATVAPAVSATAGSSGWTTTQNVTAVTLVVYEPGSKYTYTLVALPQAYSVPSLQPQGSVVATSTGGCGFATPLTGTYAATLCFVDFSGYSQTSAQVSLPGCQQMSAAIARTPYTISFCLNVTGGSVAPSAIPTYYNAPTSEAFLGSNGFYTDIPGDPALYQSTGSQTTTVTITNISVQDSNNNPATGWDLVTGDAESTDGGESITWSSNVNLNLLPNSATSQIGNACAAPTSANPAAISLTALPATTVTCAATVNSDKTGTVMLEALAPTSLTVKMVGAGLQAMFLGILLP